MTYRVLSLKKGEVFKIKNWTISYYHSLFDVTILMTTLFFLPWVLKGGLKNSINLKFS